MPSWFYALVAVIGVAALLKEPLLDAIRLDREVRAVHQEMQEIHDVSTLFRRP